MPDFYLFVLFAFSFLLDGISLYFIHRYQCKCEELDCLLGDAESALTQTRMLNAAYSALLSGDEIDEEWQL